ncbi:hypothetical protein U4E84_11960 [Halorubrum sp. AD140]|uniref:DUF7261 family protein n=1 Tax=Halorubrum sp. AD140 TaxID=3050073 RepID=UPI002ACC4D58|nr:hypothetical protein [Halorubrum sp. AD140]MDZ5812057.1 hypothetical protein [Halorubrum sp. AD140]
MADVSPPSPERGRSGSDGRFRDADRGQLLLVAGLVMAVSLVTLVVLLNATIYSENLATRGVESADGEALEVRAAAVEGTGTLVDATNRNATNESTHADVRNAVDDGIADLDQDLLRTYAGRGGTLRLETDPSGIRNGTLIADELPGEANETTVAADVDRTRGFVLDVDASSLAETNVSAAPEEAFHVVLDVSGGGSDEVYVYRNESAPDTVTVAVGDDGGTPSVLCEVDASGDGRVAVDLTGERLGDESCPRLWPADLVDSEDAYTVSVENADAADGEVTATALPESGDGVASDLDATAAVYDAEIDLRYRTAELRFETTVRVAPGEPDA